MNNEEALKKIDGLLESLPSEAARQTIREIRDLVAVTLHTDSVEIGSASKDGKLKVYFSSADHVEAMTLVRQGVGVLANARAEYDRQITGGV